MEETETKFYYNKFLKAMNGRDIIIATKKPDLTKLTEILNNPFSSNTQKEKAIMCYELCKSTQGKNIIIKYPAQI